MAASSRRLRRSIGLALISAPTLPCETMPLDRDPVAISANSNCTSRARTDLPLILKLDPLPRSMRRVISSSSPSFSAAGAVRSELSKVRVTSAKFREGREAEPAKIMSSSSPPRMDLAELSPISQRRLSTIFDLPHPLGPTTPVMPSSMLTDSGSAKDLNPVILMLVNFKACCSYVVKWSGDPKLGCDLIQHRQEAVIIAATTKHLIFINHKARC